MKFELTTWERMYLLQLVNGVRNAPLSTIRKGMKAIDALEMSEEECAIVGMNEVAQGQYQWTDSEHVFVVEISDKEASNLILSLVEQSVCDKNKNGWNMSDVRFLSLCEKLDIDIEGLNDEETA